MFPHAAIRTKPAPVGENDENGERPDVDDRQVANKKVTDSVVRMVEELEDATGSHVDDRAMRALQALSQQDKIEALTKVEEMVEHQGGQCRNLSSILQSACRKVDKQRRGRDAGNSRRARRLDEDGDAFDSSGSDGDGAGKG